MQEITRKKHEEVQEKIRAQLESIKKLIEGVEDLKTSIAKLSKQEQGLVDEINEKIKCVICDKEMQGVNVEIYESQIITDNQISMF